MKNLNMENFILKEAKRVANNIKRGWYDYERLSKLQMKFQQELLPYSNLSNRLSFINFLEKETISCFKSHVDQCKKEDCSQHKTLQNLLFLVNQERNEIHEQLSDIREDSFNKGDYFDSSLKIIEIIKAATCSIKLIDNWVDEKTLEFFRYKQEQIEVRILTKKIEAKLEMLVNKFNEQYGGLQIKISNCFHDRFIIIDDSLVYISGASIKDLGKKTSTLFAFESPELKNQIITNFITEWNQQL